MNYHDFAKLSQDQKRSAFAEWYRLSDMIEALRVEIAAHVPPKGAMSHNAHRRAIAAYYTSQQHRYDPLHADRNALGKDQIPPKAPREGWGREYERELEAADGDSCAMAELEEFDEE